jgi:hypothetical protein
VKKIRLNYRNILLVGLTLLIVVLPIVLLEIRKVAKNRLEASLDAKLAAIRQAGEPLTAPDVDKT